MKTKKKLLTVILALAMSLYALPTVWAEEFTQPQDISENFYSDTAETDMSQTEDKDGIAQSEDEISEDNTEEDFLQDDELTNSENNGISTMSLLPIETKYCEVSIYRSYENIAFLLPEYNYLFSVKEVLNQIEGCENYDGKVAYSFDDNRYTVVDLNDPIEPESPYIYYEGAKIYTYLYLILDGDQLNSENIRYHVKVRLGNSEDEFINNANIKLYNASGKDVRIVRKYYNAEENSTYIYISGKDIEEGTYPRFEVSLYSMLYGLYLFENVKIQEYDEDGVYKDIPFERKGDDSVICSPEMKHYDYPADYNGTRTCYTKLFFDISMRYYGDPVNVWKSRFEIPTSQPSKSFKSYANYYIYICNNYVSLSANSYDSSKYLYSSPNGTGAGIGYGYFNKANSFDEVNSKIYAYYYDYIDENSDGSGERSTEKIKFACFGKYNSQSEAESAGAADIKNNLFSSTYEPIDFSKGRDMTAYLSDGTAVQVKAVDVTVIDTYDIVHNETLYFGLTAKESGLSNNTYFSVSGAKTAAGRNSFNAYKITGENDGYFQNGYQTVFLLDKGKPVEDRTKIYPVFSKSSGVNIYAEDYPGVQTSGESPITFESGKAIQYAAASESGTHLKNYWVTFVTQQSGAKLFVNATNNPDHYSDNGNPQREMFLKYASDYHDIFFANIGDQELTGITVSLSEDAQGVKLDDYWTVIDSSVKTLAPFTTTSSPDNIAKVRIVPVNTDYFGEIKGTLTISSDNGGSVKIDLTGVVGIPKITTDKLYGGVKYVPYSSVIMTNNMYGSDLISFSLYGGKLPDGLELRPNGEIYGIPTKAGEFTFTVQAAYNGAEQEDGSPYLCTQTYTLVIKENTDENVDATNGDAQGHQLVERVSKYITVYYSGTNNGNPVVDRMEIDSDLFWSEGPLGELQDFYIDGIKLTEGSDYTAEEGSTKITVRDQTFGHIGITGSDVPHTLAAEFRTAGNNKLKRSAQNVYLNYKTTENDDKNPDDKPDDKPDNKPDDKPDNNPDNNTGNTGNNGNTGGNSGSNSTGVNTVNNSNPVKENGSVNAVISIVDANGEPVSGISLELHSKPKYATTDSSGTAKFDSVEFGRHTLYIKEASNDKAVSKTFSIASGSNIGIKGSVITASAGETVHMTIEYDGSKIKILSAAEDVSSASGVYGGNNILLINISTKGFSKKTLYIILLFTAAIIAFVLKRKIKS